jgi:glycerate dehydrogenase
VAAAKARSVVVTNVPSYGTQSVAQTVFAHLLNFTQHVADHSTAVKAGRWKANPDWCFWDQPLIELAQLNMGLIGLGRIGSCVAALANAFGMHVYASTPNPKSVPDFVQIVGLRDVFSVSDVISLHCPLTAETKHLVNGDMLSLMKPTALLINTSRGPLIDEHALAHALNSGQIAGAGLDVLSVEPPIEHNVLLTAKNCQITPHFAWATHAARKRLLQIAVGNIVAFLGGAPCNVVN